jgi:Calcineurin-like phosphoesterase superfamily domain
VISSPPVARRVARVIVPMVVGVTGAIAGTALWGRSTVPVGPFQVLLSSRFGHGVTVIALPPFGRLSADTHTAPLRVTATLTGVRLEELTSTVRKQGVAGLLDQVHREALERIRPFAIRLMVVSLVGALALALVAFRLRWRPILGALLAALLAMGGTELVAWRTYDQSALLSPTFSGSLSLAPRLIGPAATAIDRIDDFRAELSRVLSGALRVYTALPAVVSEQGDEIRVLHISDVHLSPLGFAFAREVAAAFDVDVVLDTGDDESFGTSVEDAAVLSEIASFHRPYVYVRGNHDALGFQKELPRVPGVRVLDGGVTSVAGLTIYGLGDPVFTPDKLSALDDALIAEQVRAAGGRVKADVSALPAPPDIVAVHDDRMAESVAGLVPLVASGHFHVTERRLLLGTLFLRIGSTGGAGANVFTQEGGIPLTAEVLYFSRAEPHRLVAYDVIEQLPESGSLSVQRHLVDRELGTLVPSASPSGSIEGPPPTSVPSSPVLTPTASPS